MNDTSDSTQLTLRKARKLLNYKQPQNYTERKTDANFTSKNIHKLMKSHRKVKEGFTRSSLVVSSNSRLTSVGTKSRLKKSANKPKKKVPVFERKDRKAATELVRGHHKTRSHIPL